MNDWMNCACCGRRYLPSRTSHETFCASCAAATEQRRNTLIAERERKLLEEEAEELKQ